MPVRHNTLIKLFWSLHLKLYQWSSGRIGHTLRGLPVLLLTTKGKKTGQPRTKALMYVPHGEAYVVIASNLGKEDHPAWWYNLQANSQAEVQVLANRFKVQAREADEEERERIWKALSIHTSDYEQYRSWTSRRVPLVILERK
jgi:deazaflavin-dependent oxidoreductase (nitroreductase family)